MNKQEPRKAIALYAICLVAMWSIIVHQVHALSFDAEILSYFLTAFGISGAVYTTEMIAKKSGWKYFGLLIPAVPITGYVKPARLPLYLQAIIDINIIIVINTHIILSGVTLGKVFALCIVIIPLLSFKWFVFNKLARKLV